MAPKRYALVGTGGRGIGMFARPLSRDFARTAELVALCDPNPLRLRAAAAMLPRQVPQYASFRRMMREADPDAVVVASPDSTHARHVIAALRAGKRAISEKPLCTTPAQCRRILAAAAQSPASCLVTHNARYGAADAAIRSILRAGRIGTPLFIQFDETLDRCHGADYFRRWHRHKKNSGGLLVHKACHHFDILNWWVGAKPAWLTARGRLAFYGKNGPFRHKRCRGCPHAARCDFYTDISKSETYRKLYLDAERADGYIRDACVFAPSIDIEDEMSAIILYENGVRVTYTLIAHSPYESQRVIVEGTDGRLEYFARTATGFAVGGHQLPGIEQISTESIKLYLPRVGVSDVPIRRPHGGHGGADPQLRAQFFGRPWNAPPTEQMASLPEAVQAVLIGAAANISIRTAKPVRVQDLLRNR